MKTRYKRIIFWHCPSDGKRKTDVYECDNYDTGDSLGYVKWHSPWRQYCWFQQSDIIMARSCLDDVSHFIGQLMDARKCSKPTGRGE